MRIVFFGSARFSLPSLERLLASRHEVRAVVTAPDRPRGRGRRLRPTEVKQLALGHDLPVLTPADLREASFLRDLKACDAHLFVVVAFRILPPEVFLMPPLGTVNLHASLLPKYRGAAPVHWAIINGETITGVTTFFIEEKVDTGDILLQREVQIRPEETAGELSERLAAVGAELLLQTIDRLEAGDLRPVPQTGEASRAPKVTREMGLIDWHKPADEIARLIRGLAPEPGAYTYWNGRLLNLMRARPAARQLDSSPEPGVVVEANGKAGELLVQAGDGRCVQVLELQPAGKRIMSAGEFLRGYRLKVGDRFGQADI